MPVLRIWFPWSGRPIRRRRSVVRLPPALAAVLCIVVVLGAEQLFERINNQADLEQERREAREFLAVTRARLEGVINANLYLVHGLAVLVSAHPDIDQAEFVRVARGLVDGRHALRSIAGAPDLVVRMVYPLDANRAALGLDYRSRPDQRKAAVRAMESDQAVLAGPESLIQGGTGLIVREPVFQISTTGTERTHFWGLIAAVIDTDRLYDLAGVDAHQASGWDFAIRGHDGGGERGAVFLGDERVFARTPVRTEVIFPGGSWQLAAQPRAGWGHAGAGTRWLIRLLGALTAALTGILAYNIARNGQMLSSTFARLESLVDTIPDIVWVKGTDGRYLSCNQRFEALVGAQPNAVIGKTDADFFEPEQVDFFTTHDRLAADSPEPIRSESWVVRASDQQRLLVETIKSPVRTAQGELVGVLGIARDITERKQAEDQIRTLSRLYAVLSGINECLVRVRDPDALYQDACRIAVVTGGFRMAWLGVPDLDSMRIKILASAGTGLDYAANLHISFGDEETARGPTGQALRLGRHVVCNDIATDPRMEFWREAALANGFRSSVALPILVAGELHGVFTLYADRPGFFTAEELRLLDELTVDIGFSLAFMQAESKVREQRDLLDRTSRMAQVGGWTFDTARMHSLWNSETARIFELDPEPDGGVEMSVDDALRFFSGEANHALTEAIDRAATEAQGFDLELPITGAKGTPKWVRCLGFPVVEAGRVVRVDGASQDITRPKRMEQEIRQLNADLEARVAARTDELASAVKELETFTYLVSHDLKAPLRGIDGYSRLLLEEHHGALGEEAQLFVRNIRTGVEQMGQLIEDLLSYSRAERRHFVAIKLELANQVGAILANWKPELEARHITVDLNLECQSIRGDPDGIKMVLGNLLDNAIKFSAHSPEPRITITAMESATHTLIRIGDNGIGFDMQFQERIFDIFQRLQRAEDYPGTGVGLAIVRKAMQRMGGRVWAESSPGKGATFFLELPR